MFNTLNWSSSDIEQQDRQTSLLLGFRKLDLKDLKKDKHSLKAFITVAAY